MAGLGNIAGALGGLGQAAEGWTQGRVDKPAYDESLSEYKAAQEARTRLSDTQTADDISAAGNVAQFADPNLHPIYQLDQWAQTAQGQAAQPLGSKPSAAQPAAGGPALAPGLGAKMPGGAAPQSQASTAPPPGWEPTDPALKELNGKYEAAQRQAAVNLAKIDQAAGNDPAKKQRMYAAYARLNQPKYDALAKEAQDYKDRIANQLMVQQANKFVDAVMAGDSEKVQGIFGQGAHPAKDPGGTGLQGVVLGDGKTFFGQNTVMARAMLEKGLIQQDKFAELARQDAKDYADLQRERMTVRASESGARNQQIEIARALQQTAEEDARAGGEKDPTKIKAAGREAFRKALELPQTKAANQAAHTAQQDSLHLSESEQRIADKMLARFVTVGKDLAGNAKYTPRNDNPATAPQQAFDAWMQLRRSNGPETAMFFRYGLTEELASRIDAYLNQGQDVGANNPPAPAASKPAVMKGPAANQERQMATDEIKKRPAAAAAIKASYKQRTGQDY